MKLKLLTCDVENLMFKKILGLYQILELYHFIPLLSYLELKT